MTTRFNTANHPLGGGNDRLSLTILAPLFLLFWGPVALAIDWQNITATELTLFYPGQHSWEWLLTQAEHPGASSMRGGANCRLCHEGRQQEMGETIAKHSPLPLIAGADTTSGSLPLKVQTVWDKQRFHMRLSWPRRADDKLPTLLTVMIDDGQVTEAVRGGCWGACHDDLAGMPSAVTENKRSKYLVASRTSVTRRGGGDNVKSPSELAALRAQGKFLEYWQVKIGSDIKPEISEFFVLEQSHAYPNLVVDARAEPGTDRWTVELSRALVVDGPGRKALKTGNTYTLGFAIHESGSKDRFHYVSFGYSLKMAPGSADMISTRVN